MASKHWNAASCGPEDERHQVCKLDFPSKKRLFLIFFNYKEPFTVDVSAEKSTITGIYNIETVLPQVFWKMEYQRSTMGTQNVLIHWDSGSLHTKKGSSSVPWLTRSLNFAFPALQYRPHPMWLLAVPSSERQTGCSCVQDLSKAVRSELRSIPPKWLSQSLQSWEVFPRSDYHRAFRAEKYSPKVTITKPSLICGDVCNYAHSTRENALKECPTSLNVWSTVSVYKPFVTLFEHLWCRWCDGGHHRLDSSPHQSDEEEERIKIQF